MELPRLLVRGLLDEIFSSLFEWVDCHAVRWTDRLTKIQTKSKRTDGQIDV